MSYNIPGIAFGVGIFGFVGGVIHSMSSPSLRMARQDFIDACKAVTISLRSNNETVAKAWETYQTKLAQMPTVWDVGRLGAFSAIAVFSGWKLGDSMAKLAGNYGATPQQQIWIARIGAIFTGAITWGLTRSAGLTFVNTVLYLRLPNNIPNNGEAIGFSACLGAVASVGYVIYTVFSGNTRGHYFQYSQVADPLVLADETVKRAMVTYRAEMNRHSIWPDAARFGAVSCVAAITGSLLGVAIAKIIGGHWGYSENKKMQISRIGGVFAGAIAWYLTGSKGLAVMNAASLALFPPL